MKYLCICQYGHSRSVALARTIHARGEAAVACGWSTNGGAIRVLSGWADHILLMCPEQRECVPPEHQQKIVDFNIGPDKWSNPYNQDLLTVCQQKFLSIFPPEREHVTH